VLWAGFCRGDRNAQDQLLASYYQELRSIARKLLSGDSAAARLQPTELANEAALRLLKLNRIELRDRSHFLSLAARVMRQVLLDEVRRFRASKRQAPASVTTWFEPDRTSGGVDFEALDAALVRLAEVSADRARVVELRFFVGLTIEEIAGVLEVSDSTVKRQWQAARAWLLRDLARSGMYGSVG
jgi:RNA polymerase sigma factor (TIGR02999 family)